MARHTSPMIYALSIHDSNLTIVYMQSWLFNFFYNCFLRCFAYKSKGSLPCASSAKLPSGEIADSHVVHGEVGDGTNFGNADMLLTLESASKSAYRSDVLTSTPVLPPSPIPMLDGIRDTHPVTVFLAKFLALVLGNFIICQAWVVPHQTYKRRLVTGMSNLAKTFKNDMSTLESNMDHKLTNLKTDLFTEISKVESDLNDQMCIVESNVHVTISALESNMSAIKSVKKWISVERQIRDFHQVLYCRYRNFTIKF